jgi:hypothetical protein
MPRFLRASNFPIWNSTLSTIRQSLSKSRVYRAIFSTLLINGETTRASHRRVVGIVVTEGESSCLRQFESSLQGGVEVSHATKIDLLEPSLPALPEHCKAAIKLSFLAPSGFGKTTAAQILGSLFGSTNVRLAEPLYALQKAFYSFIGEEIGDKQDGELLQFLGSKIQKQKPDFLASRFFEHVATLGLHQRVSIISNDDCRPHNYPYLKAWGFKFICINGFCHTRADKSPIDPSSDLEWQIGRIPYDLCISNTGTLEQLKVTIREMMQGHFNAREVLHHTNTTGL